MALGPTKARAVRESVLGSAEAYLDRLIQRTVSDRVRLDAHELGISYEDFAEVLAPRYRAAGWRIVQWHKREEPEVSYVVLEA